MWVQNDEDVYYDSGRRGYPRSRIDYADPEPVATSRYTDAVRFGPCVLRILLFSVYSNVVLLLLWWVANVIKTLQKLTE